MFSGLLKNVYIVGSDPEDGHTVELFFEKFRIPKI
jgi:hypothetical protein